MSLKLFLLSSFGGIKPTSKIEAERDSLLKDYQVVTGVEKSEELKELLALEEKVNSESFKKMKAELKALKFKGSEEEKQLKQFQKLERNKKLRKFYDTLGSEALKRYEELRDGNKLDRYFELEKMIEKGVNGDEEKSKALKSEFKKLKESADVAFLHKYPKSSAYKNYVHILKSDEKRKYEELKEILNSNEFKERKAYLEAPDKWEKTEEYKEEQRYQELKSQPEMATYFKYKDSSDFDFFKNYDLVFEDTFSASDLDTSKWKTISSWAEKTVGKNFSQEGDLHAYDDGKNIHLKSGRLQIQVKRDKVASLVWKPVFGFVEQEFDYSTDIITSNGLFDVKYGILEAKIKYQPDKNFQDVFYLGSEDNSVRLNLLESGTHSQIGVSTTNDGQVKNDALSLSGLSAGKDYVFRLEWEQGKLVWKVNNKELFAVQSGIPSEALHLTLTSMVLHDSSSLPHNFDVDWIRIYQKKK
ncbi:MAG TPA: hypothetical protein VKA27_09520 [Sunxiuqinia sp.]|nr:hypothetical protein [Sunxiuqinia sp.]